MQHKGHDTIRDWVDKQAAWFLGGIVGLAVALIVLTPVAIVLGSAR